MTAAPDAFADAMLPTALDLVVQVHDREADACHTLLRPLSWRQLAALAVVLAALVPDDRTANDLLAWTNDETPTSPYEPISEKRAWLNRLVLAQALGTTDRYHTGRQPGMIDEAN